MAAPQCLCLLLVSCTVQQHPFPTTRAIAPTTHTRRPNHTPAADQLAWWRPQGIGVAFPVIAFGFTAHQVLFAIYGSLRAPSVRRINGVIAQSMSLCCCLYCVVGAGGYVLYKERCGGVVLVNASC